MRGVEGAGAYRIGHPLGVENDSPPFRFQIFLRNMAGALQPAKYLITFTNVAPVRLLAVATESKNVAGGPKNLISGRRGNAPENALTRSRTRNTRSSTFAIAAANPASAKNPRSPATRARSRKERAQPSMCCLPADIGKKKPASSRCSGDRLTKASGGQRRRNSAPNTAPAPRETRQAVRGWLRTDPRIVFTLLAVHFPMSL